MGWAKDRFNQEISLFLCAYCTSPECPLDPAERDHCPLIDDFVEMDLSGTVVCTVPKDILE